MPNLHRITQTPTAGEQLLYFTSTSLTAQDRGLVFISDRTGHPNLFHRDFLTNAETQLTHNTEGFLKSYVYFDGRPYAGFARASVSLHPQSGTLYYIQGRQIRSVTLGGHERVLAEYPPDQMTAFTHISADGSRLCVPTTDARALDGNTLLAGKPPYDIDRRVQDENLSSYLRVYDTSTGREILTERVPKSWITHVQFSPLDPNLILYNHEWPADCGIRRMWLWNGRTHLQLRTESPTRNRADWTCHEMWQRDGQSIVYHGSYKNGPAYLGRISPDASNPIEIPIDPSFTRYGHFTVGPPNWLVSDGYYQDGPPQHPHGSGEWISLQHIDWQKQKITWHPLAQHDSSWDSQDSHPHPIFNHAGNAVYFTSDRQGKRAVWRIDVADLINQRRDR